MIRSDKESMLFYNRRQMLSGVIKAGLLLAVTPPMGIYPLRSSGMQNQNLIEKRIPVSGEKIPAIGMGTWQTFDAGNSAAKKATLEEVLRLFVDLGGKLIDSSPMYGSSEAVVGELASKLQVQKALFMATKVWTRGEEKGREQMKESMELLKVGKLDLMQVHNLVDYKTHLKTLKAWKEEGRIRYIGITHYTTRSYPDLMRVMKEFPVDFVQFNYSINTREAENTILPFAADNGVAVIINRPFEGGALFSMVKGKDLPPWASAMGIKSWGQFFLKYIISHPAVTCAIPATDNPKHLKDNMGAAFGSLAEKDERKRMADYFDNL